MTVRRAGQNPCAPGKCEVLGSGKNMNDSPDFQEKKIIQIFPEEGLCCLHWPLGWLEGRVDPLIQSQRSHRSQSHRESPAPQPPPALSLAENKAKVWQSGHQPLPRLPLEGMEGSWCRPARDCFRFKVVQPLQDGISLSGCQGTGVGDSLFWAIAPEKGCRDVWIW